MPVTVSGTGGVGPSGAIDYAFVTLDYQNASGMVEGSAMMPGSFPFTIAPRVLCESGAIETLICLGAEEEISLVRYPPTGEPEAISLGGGDPYTNECRYFVRCLQGDADPAMVSPERERDAIRVALAAQQAIQQGRVITLLDGAGRQGLQ